jgi:RNA polymerase sigma-70 factor (ECF subfamily)
MRPTPPQPPPTELVELLTAARNGNAAALGTVLDCFRLILTRTARLAIPEDLRAKIGGSDLVQQTFLEASRDFHQFHGNTEEELLAWLRRLLQNNFVNELRRWRACAKRQVNCEVRLHQAGQVNGAGDRVAAPTPSPCQEVIRRETEASLRDAVAHLPARYRQVLYLRHSEKLSHREIGSRLGMTANAARKLCDRAVAYLRKRIRL